MSLVEIDIARDRCQELSSVCQPRLSKKRKKKIEIAEATNNRCWYCGTELISEICLDHIHAKSKGGSSDRSNLRACCRSCNTRKGVKSTEEYRLYLENLNPVFKARNHILSALLLAHTPYDDALLKAAEYLHLVGERVVFYGETLQRDRSEGVQDEIAL